MRIPRSAVTTLLAAVVTTGASAFSMPINSRAFVSRAALSKAKSFPGVVNKSLRRRGGGALNMFFGNLFGGGAAGSKIDYTALDHPGPELGTAAEAGKVLVSSERDSNLQVATFAGT